MRNALVLSALVLALTGCKTTTPEQLIAGVGSIISQLHIHIEKLEPKPRIEIPLDRSGLDVIIHLGVENPTDIPINAKSFIGKLEIEQSGASSVLGDVNFGGAVSIPARSSGTIPITLQFKYNDIKSAWKPVANVAMGQTTVWKLSGGLGFGSARSTYTIPVNLSKTTGGNAR